MNEEIMIISVILIQNQKLLKEIRMNHTQKSGQKNLINENYFTRKTYSKEYKRKTLTLIL